MKLNEPEFNNLKEKGRNSYQLKVKIFLDDIYKADNHINLYYDNNKLQVEYKKIDIDSSKINKDGKVVEGSKYPLHLLDYITSHFKDEDDFVSHFYPEYNKLKQNCKAVMYISRNGKDRINRRNTYETKAIFDNIRLAKICEQVKDSNVNVHDPITRYYMTSMMRFMNRPDFIDYILEHKADPPYTEHSRINKNFSKYLELYRINTYKIEDCKKYGGNLDALREDKDYYQRHIKNELLSYKTFREMFLLCREYSDHIKELNKDRDSKVKKLS